jgi:hypothetical protein
MQEAEKVCQICEALFTQDNPACIDHNHSTGKVRSNLCRKCNCAIGLMKEDSALLIRAAEYVEALSPGG